MSAVLFVGIAIGRSGEQRRTETLLHRLSEEMLRSNNLGGLMMQDKMMQTVNAVRNYYVDPIDLDTIYEKAIPSLLSELDPHSEYIPARLFNEVNESLEGEFDGIGIVFNAMTDTITVLNVVPQGPSFKAGVRSGDRILRIDDRDVAGQGIAQDSLVKLMRGKRGTKVKLAIERQTLDELVEVEVVRDAIELHSIETAFMLDKEAGIGYVRLSQFARTSYDELREALRKLRSEGLQKLIIDLRGNTGGFLDQAILIANEFLPAEKLIVYTEDRHGNKQKEYSRGNGTSTDLGLAILVDETSASSSEILAGAIQDNDRGLVLGRRTFGKGLVQTQIPFADGSAVRLTVARYYTPTGRSIQKPYTAGDEMAYHMEIFDRYMHNEFFSADSIHFDESLKFTTPGGRTVYGGGGIMPDIFIPMDTVGITRYYTKVWDSNTLYRYTLRYADRHREALDKVTTLEELDSLLSADDLLSDFVRYAEQQGIATNRHELNISRDIILAQLRAYIGRNALGDDSGFYYNIYPVDKVMRRAVEELKLQNND
ncbi:MAG: S41 family peptidase [Alistipes sp.]|nr:S41 family peptidase [Alistipes sp.]MBR3589573.1 S41 family peptidase [Alistipes sp.]MBR3892796.1 S41 family peptidase [Alistipes sp.]MBR6630338.1 S41 family peptidase [Alistipes sp.]